MKEIISISLTACCVFLLYSRQTYAQEWTPEQREVIDAAKRCWEVWEKAGQEKNLEIYYEECAIKGETLFWWTDNPVPHSVDEFETAMANGHLFWGIKRGAVLAYRPIFVQVESDFAVLHYAPDYKSENIQGDITRNVQKRLEVFQKVGGKWKLFSGMGAPAGNELP